jgi:hypothetical protein
MRKGGKSGSGKKELPVEARIKGRMPKRIMAATERVLADRPRSIVGEQKTTQRRSR